jgi:DNA-binding transcriptional MerR regulator
MEVQGLLGVTEGYLLELERESLVTCDSEGCYIESQVERIRLCRTLQDELGVNLAGVEVALHLLERMEAERRQFREVLDWLRRCLG